MRILPLSGNPVVLQRLITLYVAVFFVVLAAFYLSLYQSSFNHQLALLSCTSAGVAFCLLRLKERAYFTDMTTGHVWPKPGTRNTVLSLETLLSTSDQLLHQMTRTRSQVGIALITVRKTGQGRPDPVAQSVIREFLFRTAHSRVFQTEDNTLAIVEAEPGVSNHLEDLTATMHAHFRARRVSSLNLADHQIVIGVAITESPKHNATELFDQAVSAIKRADMIKKDTFFRHL